MDKLSIVIPAYNVQNVIERCLDSILDQEYHIDVEIIVVNDGSTDNTIGILARYEKRYPDIIRIITKENGGVSSARNVGLAEAQGEWIWFCDADDYIKKNGLSLVLDRFVDSSIDVCTFSSITLDAIAQKSFAEQDGDNAVCIFEGTTISEFGMRSVNFVWNHIYRLSAIQDIHFRTVPIGEDVFFNLEVYRRNLRIKCTNANVYRYTVSENQLTRRRDPESMRKAVQGYELLLEYAKCIQEEHKNDRTLVDSIDVLIANQFTPFMSRLLSARLRTSEFRELFLRLKKKRIFPIKEIDKKCKIYNYIGEHPVSYPAMGFIHRNLFVPYILPRLSRN